MHNTVDCVVHMSKPESNTACANLVLYSTRYFDVLQAHAPRWAQEAICSVSALLKSTTQTINPHYSAGAGAELTSHHEPTLQSEQRCKVTVPPPCRPRRLLVQEQSEAPCKNAAGRA